MRRKNENAELMLNNILRCLDDAMYHAHYGRIVGDFDEKTEYAMSKILVDAKNAIKDLREKNE